MIFPLREGVKERIMKLHNGGDRMENQDLLQAIRQIVQEETQPIHQRLDGIDNRLDGIDQRLDKVDERLDRVDERLDGIDQRLDRVDERLDNIEMRLDHLEEDSKVTRTSVNLLLDWAEQVSDVLKVPLLKKAE